MPLIITSTGDELFWEVGSLRINIDNNERPWTPKIRVFSNFFRNFELRHTCWRMNCIEMAGYRPRQPAYIFSALNADFSCRSAGDCDKYKHLSGYFVDIRAVWKYCSYSKVRELVHFAVSIISHTRRTRLLISMHNACPHLGRARKQFIAIFAWILARNARSQ